MGARGKVRSTKSTGSVHWEPQSAKYHSNNICSDISLWTHELMAKMQVSSCVSVSFIYTVTWFSIRSAFSSTCILHENIQFEYMCCSELSVWSCLSVTFSCRLPLRLMMNSQAELITAAVWLLAVHLLRPLNCNLSKKRRLASLAFLPLCATFINRLIQFPLKHIITFTHISGLSPFDFLVRENDVCHLENNLYQIIFCTYTTIAKKVVLSFLWFKSGFVLSNSAVWNQFDVVCLLYRLQCAIVSSCCTICVEAHWV